MSWDWDGKQIAGECSAHWTTKEWDPDFGAMPVDHWCALAPHATGNHRDAAGNVRVRFEE